MLLRKADLRPRLEAEYQELIDRVGDLVAAADAERFNRRPDPEAWSAAECIDHLNATARLYIDPLSRAIDEARERGDAGDRRDGRTLLGRLIAWSMEPPPRLKMKTFAEITPTADHDPEALAETFTLVHRALLGLVQNASDVDRKRVKVRSLLDARLKLSLDDWFAFLAAHGRRHVWQAERALTETSPSNASDPHDADR